MVKVRPVLLIVLGVVVLLAALLAWAWADGGRRPLHEIAVPIAVPENAR